MLAICGESGPWAPPESFVEDPKQHQNTLSHWDWKAILQQDWWCGHHYAEKTNPGWDPSIVCLFNPFWYKSSGRVKPLGFNTHSCWSHHHLCWLSLHPQLIPPPQLRSNSAASIGSAADGPIGKHMTRLGQRDSSFLMMFQELDVFVPSSGVSVIQ